MILSCGQTSFVVLTVAIPTKTKVIPHMNTSSMLLIKKKLKGGGGVA